MSVKKIVLDFYNSDAIIDSAVMDSFLHPDVTVEWHSSKGFLKRSRAEILAMSTELSRAYTSSTIRISSIIAEGNTVAVRYSHFVKTIENPREEMLLAHFMVFWELLDNKLYRGFQMTQLT